MCHCFSLYVFGLFNNALFNQHYIGLSLTSKSRLLVKIILKKCSKKLLWSTWNQQTTPHSPPPPKKKTAWILMWNLCDLLWGIMRVFDAGTEENNERPNSPCKLHTEAGTFRIQTQYECYRQYSTSSVCFMFQNWKFIKRERMLMFITVLLYRYEMMTVIIGHWCTKLSIIALVYYKYDKRSKNIVHVTMKILIEISTFVTPVNNNCLASSWIIVVWRLWWAWKAFATLRQSFCPSQVSLLLTPTGNTLADRLSRNFNIRLCV